MRSSRSLVFLGLCWASSLKAQSASLKAQSVSSKAQSAPSFSQSPSQSSSQQSSGFSASVSKRRSFQAFKLSEARMIYRKPLLASGPAMGLQGALPAGTELLLVYKTRSKEWAFVKGEDALEGWIPTAWIRGAYPIHLADVRLRYYPDPAEIEVPFELTTDLELWGDDLLLEALSPSKP